VNRAASTGLALAVAISVFLVDQGTKRLVEGSMRVGESIPMLPNVLYLTHTRNNGGAFGILGGQSSLLMLGSTVAVAFVVWMLVQGSHKLATTLGCGLILGGAAGNLLDRLTTGQVTDYIDLRVWPVFNAADVAIVLGAATLILAALQPLEKGQSRSRLRR
jgi:signal peptidase II